MQPDRTEVVYRIDRDDVLILFNDEWNRFAEENGGLDLIGEKVCRRSLWDFIGDLETRHIHETLLAKVRSSGDIFNLPFRCDSPGLRRFMEMNISPVGNGWIEYRCRIVKTEVRDPVPLIAGDGKRGAPFLRMCSWCKKVDAGSGSWLEVEDAVKVLRIFLEEHIPQISHTMCDSCMISLTDED